MAHHSSPAARPISAAAALLALAIGSPSAQPRQSAATDLVELASWALWSNNDGAKGRRLFADRRRPSAGFVGYVENARLEDRRTYGKALHTHPAWRENGRLEGEYRGIKIPPHGEFRAEVGFLEGAKGSDGVTFSLHVLTDGGRTLHQMGAVTARYDGRLDLLVADLSRFAGQAVTLRLSVNAGRSSGQDWAVWASARVQPKARAMTDTPAPRKPAFESPPAAMRLDVVMGRKTPPPPEAAGVVPLDPLVGETDIALRTIRNRLYRSGKPNEYYYLPEAFRLARDPGVGWRMSAIWTRDQKILVTLTLRADVDPAELAFVRRVVAERHGAAARLLPLPVSEATLSLEGREAWEIERPAFASLDVEIPLAITMTPEAFADFKASIETEGFPATFILKSGEQQNALNAQISLRYPTGMPYTPLTEVEVAYERPYLVFGGVRNTLDFPVTIDAADVQFKFDDWSDAESYKGLRIDPPIELAPGEAATVRAEIAPSAPLAAKLAALGSRTGTTDTPAETERRSVWEDLKKAGEEILGRRTEAGGTTSDPRTPATDTAITPSPELKAAILRYGLRVAEIDFACQPCLDDIWSKLEIATYIDRVSRLQLEALESTFGTEYGDGRRLERLTVNLRSPHFLRSGGPGGGDLLRTVVLSSEHRTDESLLVYLPASGDEPLQVRFRLLAIMSDGSRFESSDWTTVTDTLGLTIGAADVRRIVR